MEKKSKGSISLQQNWKRIFLGIILAIFANCIYVSNMFAVVQFQLSSAELCFVKSILQTVGFGIVVLKTFIISRMTKRDGFDNEEIEKKPSRFSWKPAVLAICYGASNALMTILAYMAVMMIPLSDCVVFGHTSPVFTLILSAIFLRSKISIYKVSFCALLIIGVVLVTRPTFIFGAPLDQGLHFNHSNVSQDYHYETNPPNLEVSDHTYLIGTFLSLGCGFSGAVGHITSAKSRDYNVSNSMLMVVAGLFTFVISGVAIPLNMINRFFYSDLIWTIKFYPELVLMTGISIGSMVGGIVVIIANQNAPPVVISIVRASEILIALVLDLVTKGVEGHGFSAVIGSTLVLLSIVGMTLSDWLASKQICGRNKNNSKNQDLDLDDDDDEKQQKLIETK